MLDGMMIGKGDIAPHRPFQIAGEFAATRPNFSSVTSLDRTRYPRGTRLVMGNALTARLFFSLRRRGVEILFDALIADIVRQNGRVLGAKIKLAGEEMYVRTRKGVVLATGGYAHNKRFREAFMPRHVPIHSLSSEFNEGDGVAIGERLGARIAPQEHANSGLWTPVSVTTRADGTKGLFPHLMLDRAKPGLIAVTRPGAGSSTKPSRTTILSKRCSRQMPQRRQFPAT